MIKSIGLSKTKSEVIKVTKYIVIGVLTNPRIMVSWESKAL